MSDGRENSLDSSPAQNDQEKLKSDKNISPSKMTTEKEITPEASSTHSKSTNLSTNKAPDDHEWIQGIPLFMVLAGVTLVVFLMLLDVAILSTVGIQFGWEGTGLTGAGCS